MLARARLWCAALAIVTAAAGTAIAKEGLEEEAAARDPSHVAARQAIDARRYRPDDAPADAPAESVWRVDGQHDGQPERGRVGH